MKLTSLQAFVAVLESGSIHAGARKLGISQPALSKTLRALEEELGVQLVTRTSRGTVATAYGRTFLQRAQLIVREVSRATEEVEQLKGNLRGTLSISVTPSSTLDLLPLAVRGFRRDCPDVDLHVSESRQPKATELVRSNAVELAIAPMNLSMAAHEFRAESLIVLPMAPVIRKQHKLESATRLADLSDADWLQIGPDGSSSDVIVRAFEDVGLKPPRISITCQSLNSAISLMLSNDLVSFLPLPLVQLPQIAKSFTVLKFKNPPPEYEIGLIYRADSPLTPAAQIMANHLRKAAADLKESVQSQTTQVA